MVRPRLEFDPLPDLSDYDRLALVARNAKRLDTSKQLPHVPFPSTAETCRIAVDQLDVSLTISVLSAFKDAWQKPRYHINGTVYELFLIHTRPIREPSVELDAIDLCTRTAVGAFSNEGNFTALPTEIELLKLASTSDVQANFMTTSQFVLAAYAQCISRNN